MRNSTLSPSLTLAAGAVVALVLTGCSDDSPTGSDPIPVSDAGTSANGGESGTSAVAPTDTSARGTTTGGASPTGGSGDDPDDIDVEDQRGDGSTVTVGQVRAVAAGFVVITADDDLGTVFGSAAVPAGSSTAVAVPTSITATGEYDAVLYADSDGNGTFDPATDQPVLEIDDDDDEDEDDIVSDDFDYAVG